MPPHTLAPNDIHIWFVFPNDVLEPQLLEKYHALLTEEEAHQQKRFHFERHQHQYLLTRALVKATLSQYVDDVSPQDWRFVKNDYGKPEIEPGLCELPLRFNLSHTEGLIVCAVGLNIDLGVDVEQISRKVSLQDLAKRFFSESEAKDLLAMPVEQQRARFFDYWTLKEAYIKAKGKGISIPLDQFAFHLNSPDTFHASFDQELEPSNEYWKFAFWNFCSDYKCALALNTPATNYQVRFIQTHPFSKEAWLPTSYNLQKPLQHFESVICVTF